MANGVPDYLDPDVAALFGEQGQTIDPDAAAHADFMEALDAERSAGQDEELRQRLLLEGMAARDEPQPLPSDSSSPPMFPGGAPQPQAQPELGQVDPSTLGFYTPQMQQQPAPQLPELDNRGIVSAAQVLSRLPGEYHKLTAGEDGTIQKILGLQREQQQKAAEVQDAVVEFQGRQAAIMEEGVAAQQELEKRLQKKIQAAQVETQNAYNAYQTAINEKIEPNERWGAARTIGSAIAMAFGAAGASLTGGPNHAMNIIKMQIDKEANDYRQRVAAKGQRVAERNQMYSIARQHFADTESQIAAAKAQQWRDVERKIDMHAQKSASPIARLRAAEAKSLAQRELAQAEHTLKREQIKNRLILGQASLQAETQRAAIRGAQAQRVMDVRKTQSALLEKERKLNIPGLIRDPDVTPSESTVKEIRKKKGDYDTLSSHLDDLISWRKKYWSEDIPSAELTKAKKLIARALKASASADMAGAALSEFEASLTGLSEEGVLADPGQYGFFLAALEELKRLANKEMEKKFAPAGYSIQQSVRKQSGSFVGKRQ